MAKYFLTNKAIDDLSKIWNYTFDFWSERQADLYYQMLIESFREIAKNPSIGKKYEGIITQLFGLRSGRHVIFYRTIDNNKIEITRILHEQMDLKNRILE